MARLLRSIITVALAGLPVAHSTSTIGSTVTSASNVSGIEVDVIFPIHNSTYNITESLPIVFALQNLTAAAALGPFTFSWDIMPYGNVGGIQEPGGVLNDVASVYFTAANATAEPYILVNQTNVQKWYYGPFYPYGSVYALQWAIIWDDPVKICDSNPLDLLGTLFFNIDINSPEPKIANVTGQCPQLGAVYEISTASLNSSCSAVVSNNGTGNPCTVTVDQTMVANISSTLRSLVAASTATPSASATTPSSTAKHSIAVGSNVPLSYILATAFIGALQMVM